MNTNNIIICLCSGNWVSYRYLIIFYRSLAITMFVICSFFIVCNLQDHTGLPKLHKICQPYPRIVQKKMNPESTPDRIRLIHPTACNWPLPMKRHNNLKHRDIWSYYPVKIEKQCCCHFIRTLYMNHDYN